MAGGNKFYSRNAGLNLRKPVWVCSHCRRWYYEKQSARVCEDCTGTAFYYFASRTEARRFGELCLLLDHGQIANLEVSVRFPLDVNGIHICDYVLDFRYTNQKGATICEDVKEKGGFTTDVYQLKKKLMFAIHGIKLLEV